jgi:integrase
MRNSGKSDYSIRFVDKSLTYIAKHCNLNEPEKVKHFIANLKASNGYKKNLCLAYNKYCKHYQIQWEMPLYIPEAKTIRIPTHEKIEMLIAGAGQVLSPKLQISKETGLRPVELCRLRVKDIDLGRRLIYPTTAKHGSARKLKISSNLQATLQNYVSMNKLNLNDKLLKDTAENYGKHYRMMRNSLAKKLNDTSFKNIRLYDFRHHYATNLYAKTRDILLVMNQMGHRQIKTTMIYTQLLNLNEDEWICKTATNIKDATTLIEAGFEYVTEIDGTKLFKKRK